MPSPQTIFSGLIPQVRVSRPDVAAVLERHKADIFIVANNDASDEARVEALLRAGASTIEWAKATAWPTGSSVANKRLTADLALLHEALRLAEDPGRLPEYRRRARATAYGIGMVIAGGLSHMEVPGGLDIQIWRACGTRQYTGVCDDDLCRICREHDRARAALRSRSGRRSFPWRGVGIGAGVAAIALAVVKPWK